MPDIPNADITVPAIIVGVCLLLMLVTRLLTRPKPSVWDLPQPQTDTTTPAKVVSADGLGDWHREHGPAVQDWIENHENVLKLVSGNGLTIDLNNDLTSRHEALGPSIEGAVASHPSPPMRAQLSAMVVASRASLDALRRSDWSAAERQHLTYLEYRDQWLARLRQFTAGDTDIASLRNLADQTPERDFRPTA